MFKNILTIFISIIICVGIGLASQQLQTEALNNWYPFLAKSQITPPDYVFPIVWGILYILMGISIGLILLTQEIKKSSCLLLFLLQLGLNFAWSFFFFYLENPAYGTVIILLLDVIKELRLPIFATWVLFYQNFILSSSSRLRRSSPIHAKNPTVIALLYVCVWWSWHRRSLCVWFH